MSLRTLRSGPKIEERPARSEPARLERRVSKSSQPRNTAPQASRDGCCATSSTSGPLRVSLRTTATAVSKSETDQLTGVVDLVFGVGAVLGPFGVSVTRIVGRAGLPSAKSALTGSPPSDAAVME